MIHITLDYLWGPPFLIIEGKTAHKLPVSDEELLGIVQETIESARDTHEAIYLEVRHHDQSIQRIKQWT